MRWHSGWWWWWLCWQRQWWWWYFFARMLMVGLQKTMMTEQYQFLTVPRLWSEPIATQMGVEGEMNYFGNWKRAFVTVANETAGEQQRTAGF